MKKIFRWIKRIFEFWGRLIYVFITSKEKRKSLCKSEHIWNKTLACSCGAYPIYYPYIYDPPMNKWRKKLTGNWLLTFLSYYKINEKIKKNNSIYVRTDDLEYFKRKILPKIRIPFVLVTGDSDDGTSKNLDITENKYLIHWFAQNHEKENKKVTAIPIGLDLHSSIFMDRYGEGNKTPEEQEKILRKIAKIKSKRKNLIFSNFHLTISHPRRKAIFEKLKNNKNTFWQEKKLSRTESWKLQKKFDFVFSPRGNGIDCHRTWEALILEQIPVVEKTNTPLDDLHKKFPIVMLNSLSEINEKNLKIWKKEYQKKFTPEVKRMLTNEYWIEQIEKKKKIY